MTKSDIATGLTGLIFILGAQDPEMLAIEAAIRAVYAHYEEDPYVVYAGFTGADGVVARCHGGVAYKGTHLIDESFVPRPIVDPSDIDGVCGYSDNVPYEDQDGLIPVWIECAVEGGDRKRGFVVDHHRPGDAGYGAAPEKFWEASSIGQLHRLLTRAYWVPSEVADAAFGEERYLVAASDHCPSHAFQGRCPGVDIAALTAMRARNSAAFNKQTPEEWLLVVNAAIEKLKLLPVAVAGGHEYRVSTEDIPLLNHAQLIAGLPVQYIMQGTVRDPRVKVGLLGGEPAMIMAWMVEKAAGELVDVYGDAQRGYAGGYLPS